MGLLADPLWFADLLNCLQVWLREEPELITKELGTHVDKLIHVFSFARAASAQTFLKSLEPLVSIVQECPLLSVKMAEQGVIPSILTGLAIHEGSSYIRNQLLLVLLFLVLHCKDAKKSVPDKDKMVKGVTEIMLSATGRVKDISKKILNALSEK